MRRGNRIGRVRRLRAIRPIFLTACDDGGRAESYQATAFVGELKTPSRRLEPGSHELAGIRLANTLTGRRGVAARVR